MAGELRAARDPDIDAPEQVSALAEDLAYVARLCQFLERKSAEYLGLDQP
mgnify:CR=1 FL=1